MHIEVYEPGGSNLVYYDWNLFDIAAGETLEVAFADWELPDEMWRLYELTAYTDLNGDLQPGNDSVRLDCIITSDTAYSNFTSAAPSINGYLEPGEWDDAYYINAGNVAGRHGAKAGPAHAWFKHDAEYAYFAVELPNVDTRSPGSGVELYLDQDGDGEWPNSGTAEGNYRVWVNSEGIDEVQYRPWTGSGPGVYATVPSALSVSSALTLALVFEARVPLGDLPYEIDLDPAGDEAGLHLAAYAGDRFHGWWPTDIDDELQWCDPAYYGRWVWVSSVLHDVGVTAILDPVGSKPVGSPVTPRARVTNFGDGPETDVPVRMTITGPGATYDRTIITDLPQGPSPVTVSFPGWTPDQPGEWLIACRTELPGDQVPANDELTCDCTVLESAPLPAGWVELKPMPGTGVVRRGGWLATGPAPGRTDADPLIYAARGNKSPDFHAFDPKTDAWTRLAGIPLQGRPPERGCRGVGDGDRTIYVVYGNNTSAFLGYDIETGTWTTLAPVPDAPSGKRPKGGGDLVVADGCVYFLKGDRSDFARFNIAPGVWEQRASPPGGRFKRDSWLVADADGTIYLHQAREHGFWRYDPGADAWSAAATGMPFPGNHGGKVRSKKAKDGSSAAVGTDNLIYALKGGNTTMFYRHDPGTGTWTELPGMPAPGSSPKPRRAGAGADIIHAGNDVFYALKGNKTNEFWRYAAPTAPAPGRPERGGIAAGAEDSPLYRMHVGPNPLTGRLAVLNYRLPGTGSAGLTVLDPSGRVVLSRLLAAAPNGSTTLDLGGLSAGIYLVRLEAAGFSAVRKLVLQR